MRSAKNNFVIEIDEIDKILIHKHNTISLNMSKGALLEHLNLNVIDKETARAFYVDVLGGALNPSTTNKRQVHVNFGLSQFHLPFKRTAKLMDPVVDAQEWNGDVSLSTTMSKKELLSRAEKSKHAKVIEVSSDFVRIQGPYGNMFSISFLKQNMPDLKGKYKCHDGVRSAWAQISIKSPLSCCHENIT